jgi:ACS family hexuronate transporter-like MFS transporter
MIGVAFYSVAAIATSLARGLTGFAFFRFLLGLGESANWPGAAKAVSEWFPARERGLAVALYDSGSAIGGAVAPVLVLSLLAWFGSWRPAFVITGTLGFIWLLFWWRFAPASVDSSAAAKAQKPSATMGSLLEQRKTWGLILGRSLTDPVWFFTSDWFAIYLVSKGFRLEETVAGFWVPFLAADLGNFTGGGLSSWLIHRGWDVVRARQAIVIAGGVGMTMLIPTLWSASFPMIIGLFAIATFGYAALSTMMLALPADLYESKSVASVSGMTGTGAGIGTILSTLLIGWVSDRYSFAPVLTAASIVPLAAVACTLWLVRPDHQTER